MTAEEYLNQYLTCKCCADRCRMEIRDRLKLLQRDARSPVSNKAKLEFKSIISKSIKDLNENAASYEARSKEISDTVDKLPGVEGEVIRLRYIDGMMWEDVADAVFYTTGGVFKAHRRGLRMVEAILNE